MFSRSHRDRACASHKNHNRTLKMEALEPRLCLAGDSPFLAGEVLVQFTADADLGERQEVRGLLNAGLVRSIHTRAMQATGTGVLERFQLPQNMPVDAAIRALRGNPHVLVAEPNYILTAAAISNDPGYTAGNLWGMESDDSPVNVGPAGTTNLYGSQAEEAWNNGITGSSSVYVGIIDEGFQYNHPDLIDNAWVNPLEQNGTPGVDDDGNGYIDDIHGWDFYNNDNTPYDGTGDDHGTHVAGTIGGTGGNGLGVVGVNWDVTMISAKFLGPNGGSTSGAIEAVDYLTDLKINHGINLVASNNSWGGGGYSSLLEAAITRGAQNDILFIAAAGNNSSDIDASAYYPASYSTTAGAGYDAVIAVASITSSGAKSSFSNWGATRVDIAAPGSSIYSTLPDGYGTYSGTSMATPHVAGAAALYASQFPGASATEIKDVLLQSAVPTNSVNGITVTGGRLDVNAALELGNPPGLQVNIDPANSEVLEGNSGATLLTFEVSLDETAANDTPITVDWRLEFTGDASASDFTANSPLDGVLTFLDPTNPNALSQLITLEVMGDFSLEPNETFEAVIVSTSSGTLQRTRATGTIIGDDAEIEGTIWNDANRNGSVDAGEVPMAGVTAFLDDNNDGILGSGELSQITDATGGYQFLVTPGNHIVRLALGPEQLQTFPTNSDGSLDPDDFSENAILNEVRAPAATLSAVGTSVANANVTAFSAPYTSTGTRSFASSWNNGLWNTGDAELRVDFSSPVNSVSIDAISDDTSDFAILKAYDVSGNLVGEYTTGDLATGVSETMTVTGTSNEISYVLAAGLNGQFAWLDNLVYSSIDDGSNIPIRVNVGPNVSSGNDFGVASNASLSLVITPDTFSEAAGAGAASGTISRTGDTSANLLVTISNSDETEASTIATVTIPANQSSVDFSIDAIDDALVDGEQVVTFTISADGYDNVQAEITVTDNDTPLLDQVFADTTFSNGLITGSFDSGNIIATHADPQGAGQQTLTESSEPVTGGKRPKYSSVLEYHWSFNGLNQASTFHVDATQTNGDDNFRWEFSSDGGATWSALGTTTLTSQTLEVTGLNISGDTLVRVVDTDRTALRGSSSPTLDSISVDLLYFESETNDLREPVSVTGTGNAEESASTPVNGSFTFTRNSNFGDLTIFYSVDSGSTATADVDYVAVSDSVTIPDGATFATVVINPLDDLDSEGTETVIISIIDDPSYDYRGSGSTSAMIEILDDDLSSFTANSETTIDGTIVANSYLQTQVADGVVETIEEFRTGGRPNNRVSYMEHRWTFNNVSDVQSFYLEGYRSDNNEGDNFLFSYSVDGQNWTDMFTVNSSTQSLYQYSMSAPVSGDLIVRVVDTGLNSPGSSNRDTISIDHMYFSSTP